MKIIGKTEDGYIAEVSHTELEKSADKYYGNLDRLKIGDEHCLAKGYDFRDDIQRASDAMIKASEIHTITSKTMTDFSLMLAKHTDKKKD